MPFLSNKSAFLMINTIQNAIFNDKSGIQKFASYFERQDTIQNAVFVIKNAVFIDKKVHLNNIVSLKTAF